LAWERHAAGLGQVGPAAGFGPPHEWAPAAAPGLAGLAARGTGAIVSGPVFTVGVIMVTGTHARASGWDSAAVWGVLPKAAVTAAAAAGIITPTRAVIQAVVTHYRAGSPGRHMNPVVLAVEAVTAACLLGGALQSVPTAQAVMAGLNCGTLCSLAWPVLAAGLDTAIAVPCPGRRFRLWPTWRDSAYRPGQAERHRRPLPVPRSAAVVPGNAATSSP
jgi:hypothetical protein